MDDLIEEMPVVSRARAPNPTHPARGPSSEPLSTPGGQSACDITEAIQAKIHRERIAMGWKAINAHIRSAPVYAWRERIIRAYACILCPIGLECAWGGKCVERYYRVGAWHDVENVALCDEEYVVPAPCTIW